MQQYVYCIPTRSICILADTHYAVYVLVNYHICACVRVHTCPAKGGECVCVRAHEYLCVRIMCAYMPSRGVYVCVCTYAHNRLTNHQCNNDYILTIKLTAYTSYAQWKAISIKLIPRLFTFSRVGGNMSWVYARCRLWRVHTAYIRYYDLWRMYAAALITARG